jgi:phosphate transport system substrate-binding protein
VSRDDYTVTEAHPETAEGVIGDANGLGFLPYPRYVEVQDQVKLLGIDAGDGCVAPDATTIQDGSYAPLSRRMYIYVNQQALARPEVADFLRFHFADAAGFAEAGGLVPSAASVYEDNLARLEAAMTGSGMAVGSRHTV